MKTDIELKRDVENELKWEPSVNEAHIGVSVKEGIVTLTGHVPNYAEKYGAEKAAKRVFGVRAVADELDVKITLGAKRSDEDIAHACVNALKHNALVPDEKIKVIVNTGRVTLEGEVEWHFQEEAALNAVRYLTGVLGVTNSIKIKTRVSPTDVKDKIKAAFHRSAEIDARKIDIESHDGKVILKGSVRSWAERDEAQEAAWAAPGVTAVENNILVAS